MDEQRNIGIKSAAQQIVEARFGEPLPALIERLYHDERLTQEKVAERLDVSRPTLVRWMRRFGIRARYTGRGVRKVA